MALAKPIGDTGKRARLLMVLGVVGATAAAFFWLFHGRRK